MIYYKYFQSGFGYMIGSLIFSICKKIMGVIIGCKMVKEQMRKGIEQLNDGYILYVENSMLWEPILARLYPLAF